MREFRLPSGDHTTDVNLFSDEWDKIRKPLEALGFRICGFDPGISLCDAKTGHGHFTMPLYAVKKFLPEIEI